MTRAFALFMGLLLVNAVFAHDLYLMPVRFVVQAGAVITVGLHNGDSFPESEISPALERERDMKLISAAGAWEVENLRVSGKIVQGEVRIPHAGSYIITAKTIPHAFQLGAKEFNAYLKEEGLAKVQEWRREHGAMQTAGRERYSKYAKALLTTGGSNEFHSRQAGLAMEIVPEISPYDLKVGADLPVQVLLRGLPAVDLQVEVSLASGALPTRTTVLGRTDKQGRIVIPHVSTGKWRIHAVSLERCKDASAADWESSWASLTFELP
jgi:uncharacterized GH25 family protein